MLQQVNFEVLFDVTRCCAGELTLHASERLLTWMCQHVRLDVTICCAFVFTMLAAEWLFSGMNKNVNFQISRAGERRGTHRASVGFLSSLLCFGFGCERHFRRFCPFSLNEASNAMQIFLCFNFVSLVSELWIDWRKKIINFQKNITPKKWEWNLSKSPWPPPYSR